MPTASVSAGPVQSARQQPGVHRAGAEVLRRGGEGVGGQVDPDRVGRGSGGEPLDQERPGAAHEVEHPVLRVDAAEAHHRRGDRRVRGAGEVGDPPAARGQRACADADQDVPAGIAGRPGAQAAAHAQDQLALRLVVPQAGRLGEQLREPGEHRRVAARGLEPERRGAADPQRGVHGVDDALEVVTAGQRLGAGDVEPQDDERGDGRAQVQDRRRAVPSGTLERVLAAGHGRRGAVEHEDLGGLVGEHVRRGPGGTSSSRLVDRRAGGRDRGRRPDGVAAVVGGWCAAACALRHRVRPAGGSAQVQGRMPWHRRRGARTPRSARSHARARGRRRGRRDRTGTR